MGRFLPFPVQECVSHFHVVSGALGGPLQVPVCVSGRGAGQPACRWVQTGLWPRKSRVPQGVPSFSCFFWNVLPSTVHLAFTYLLDAVS